MSQLPLIWVELGRKIPAFAFANFKLHSELFPNLHQILLTDQEVKPKVHHFCEVVPVGDFFNQELSREFYRRINRSTAQLDFWVNTTMRFFVLNEFAKSRQLDVFIHAETDNVILDMTPIFEVFADSSWGIAFPMQTANLACASIMLVNGRSALQELIDVISNEWSKLNTDDMQILGNFSLESKSFRKLETSPSDCHIYDAGTYGKYLFGADARNFRLPYSKRGSVDTRVGAVNADEVKISFSLRNQLPSIFVESKDGYSCLVNLHIHSKRIPSSISKLNSAIVSNMVGIGSTSWIRGKIDWIVLLERLTSWFYRKVLKVNREIRLR